MPFLHHRNRQIEIDKKIQGIRSDRVPEELWTEVHDIEQEAVIKTIPKKNKCKKAKWLSEEVGRLLEEGVYYDQMFQGTTQADDIANY